MEGMIFQLFKEAIISKIDGLKGLSVVFECIGNEEVWFLWCHPDDYSGKWSRKAIPLKEVQNAVICVLKEKMGGEE